MNELSKVYKVISKITEEITIIINLDANIGQNGLKQIEEFNKIFPIDGIILNKMDGTAKGGIVLAILNKFKIPVLFLGVGEGINDLLPFDIDSYINSLFVDKEIENG